MAKDIYLLAKSGPPFPEGLEELCALVRLRGPEIPIPSPNPHSQASHALALPAPQPMQASSPAASSPAAEQTPAARSWATFSEPDEAQEAIVDLSEAESSDVEFIGTKCLCPMCTGEPVRIPPPGKSGQKAPAPPKGGPRRRVKVWTASPLKTKKQSCKKQKKPKTHEPEEPQTDKKENGPKEPQEPQTDKTENEPQEPQTKKQSCKKPKKAKTHDPEESQTDKKENEPQEPHPLQLMAQQSAQRREPQPKTDKTDNEPQEPQTKKAKTRQNCNLDSPITFPLSIESRASSKTRVAESYILQNTAKFRYVVGVRESQTPAYQQIIDKVFVLLNDKTIETPLAAREWVKARLQR